MTWPYKSNSMFGLWFSLQKYSVLLLVAIVFHFYFGFFQINHPFQCLYLFSFVYLHWLVAPKKIKWEWSKEYAYLVLVFFNRNTYSVSSLHMGLTGWWCIKKVLICFYFKNRCWNYIRLKLPSYMLKTSITQN